MVPCRKWRRLTEEALMLQIPPITIHEATVQSMQVSIHTLRVGRKQVTMGLFRQLPRSACST